MILVLVFSFLFTGCAEKKLDGSKYLVKEIGQFDNGVSVGHHRQEMTFKFEQSVDNKYHNSEKTVVWRGDTYTGVYEKTVCKSSDTLLYYDSDKASFSVDADTGKLTSFLMKDKACNYDGLTEKTEEERRLAADSIVSELAEDSGSYTLVENNCIVSGGEYSIYEYVYSRMLGEVKTEDQISVKITSYGTYKAHSSYALGKYKDVVLPDTYDREEVEKAITLKLNDIYKDVGSEITITYGDRNEIFIRLDDGTLAVLSNIEVKIDDAEVTVVTNSPTGEDIGRESVTETVQLVVRLEG